MSSKPLILLLLATCALSARAGGDTLAEARELQDAIGLLKLKAEKADLEAKAEARPAGTKKAEAREREKNTPLPDLPPFPPSALLPGLAEESLPVVRAIEGIDGVLRATLLFTGSGTMTVAVGDAIPGDWRVSGISAASVTVTRNKATRRLSFGREAPAPQSGAPMAQR